MKKVLAFSLLCLVPYVMTEGVRYVRFLQGAEESLRDLRIRFFSPATTPNRDIVIVAFDEETMQSLPFRSPIPRDFLQQLHTQIAAAHPRLMAYDLFFKDPSFPAADEHFAKALRRFPSYAVSLGRDSVGGVIEEDLPLALFRDGLAGFGLADLPLNPFSQVVRRAAMSYPTTDGLRPTFVGAIFEALTGQHADAFLRANPLHAAGFDFPHYDKSDSIVIRYVKPPTQAPHAVIPTFSARLVADGLIPAEWFEGKVILIGAEFNDAQDLFITPYYSSTYSYRRVPGVEIHAQILSSLLTGQLYGLFTPWQDRLFVALLICLTIGMAFAGRSWRLFTAPIFLLSIIIGLSILCMRRWGLFIPLVTPSLAIIIAYGSSLVWRFVSEGQQRRWLRSTFAKYVSSSVVEELLRHPERASLGGELRDITCLFSDIANFTTMSERLAPHQVVQFLNDYLGTLSQPILKNGGTIDKYEGDSIVAFFGAPLPSSTHADNTIAAAVAMQEASRLVSDRWETIIGQAVVTRIGIHSGEAVVGNIGSDVRFDYTAIGDTVNIASRLEGINKEFGTTIIVSDGTRQRLHNSMVELRALGPVRLKGKSIPLTIFEAVFHNV